MSDPFFSNSTMAAVIRVGPLTRLRCCSKWRSRILPSRSTSSARASALSPFSVRPAPGRLAVEPLGRVTFTRLGTRLVVRANIIRAGRCARYTAKQGGPGSAGAMR